MFIVRLHALAETNVNAHHTTPRYHLPILCLCILSVIPIHSLNKQRIYCPLIKHMTYEGHSKRIAIQYDAQMAQAKFLCYYSI